MLCYTTYSYIAAHTDIAIGTCGPKIYTLSYVIEGTSKWLMKHICSTRFLETLKAHSIGARGSHVAHNCINIVCMVNKVMHNQYLGRLAKV